MLNRITIDNQVLPLSPVTRVFTETEQGLPRTVSVKRSLAQMIADQAAQRPQAAALCDGEHILTYADLHRRSNQLAGYLQSCGVGPDVLVGCYLERSIDMVVAWLSILKAGGAYVPLDISYPRPRLAFMLEDAQIPLLITRKKGLDTSWAEQHTQLLYLDSDSVSHMQQCGAEREAAAPAEEDLAYVIYTSGSTGRPKGVEIMHGGLLNLIHWHQHAFGITGNDRATQFASPSFDAAGWEVWPYLTAGACVYFVDEEIRLVPTKLRDWLVAHAITVSFLPTVLAENMLTLEWPATTALRYLLTGADTLHHYPTTDVPFLFVNNYGPTEATVVATSGGIWPGLHSDKRPSIGHPIANTEAYVLDEARQQVATGEVGELYLGGVGLARGYHNQPALTAEKFIPHPFRHQRGARLYKTGDLVRVLADGSLEFIGRVDQQVKIRGYRIEPGEVEAVLNQIPLVQQAVVTVTTNQSEEKQLVAYIVPRQQTNPTLRSQLYQSLSQQLPEYMIPSIFVLVDALPLTLNGKIDRAALPAPDVTNMLSDADISMPHTETERVLVRIIASLLNLERVGINENFFMLGGHSLLATQLIARVAATFGVDLSFHTLFLAPTIQQLAPEIERHMFRQ